MTINVTSTLRWNYNTKENSIPFSKSKPFFVFVGRFRATKRCSSFSSASCQQSPPRTTHTRWPRYSATRPTRHVSSHPVRLERRSDDCFINEQLQSTHPSHRAELFLFFQGFILCTSLHTDRNRNVLSGLFFLGLEYCLSYSRVRR